MRVGETFVEHIPRVVYELWPSPFRDEEGRPLAAGDEGYGARAGRRRAGRAATRGRCCARSPYEALEDDGGPEYDLDGNVVEPQPEDPWGSEAEAPARVGSAHVRMVRRAADDPRRGPPVRAGGDRARSGRSSSTATCRPTTSSASCSPPSAWTRWRARASRRASSGRSGSRPGRRSRPSSGGARGGGGGGAITLIPIIEICRHSPGHGHRDGRVAWGSRRPRS